MNYPFRNAAIDFVRGADAAAVADAILSILRKLPQARARLRHELPLHPTTPSAPSPPLPTSRPTAATAFWQSGRRIPLSRMDDAVRRELLAYALLFTLPGVPCIYYGDEIAMQGYPRPVQPRLLRLEQHRTPPARSAGEPGRAAPQLRRVQGRGPSNGSKSRGGCAAISARVGRTQTAEIILNRGEHLIATQAFGKAGRSQPARLHDPCGGQRPQKRRLLQDLLKKIQKHRQYTSRLPGFGRAGGAAFLPFLCHD